MKYVHAWIDSYESTTAGYRGVCDAVADKYEQQVQRYGYSLKHLRRVVPTLFLKDYLLVPDPLEQHGA